MPDAELVSVVIPAYNAARFLPDAIASIRQQSYEPLEIILVDDGSTDETRSLVERWPDVRYLHQQNQGAAAARNAGIQAARGDLLAFLDADDVWTPDHLRLLLPHLLADPQLRFVWGTTRIVELNEDAADTRTYEVLRENVPMFLLGSALYRTSVFTEVGRFDPTLRIVHDMDWLAAARQMRVAGKRIADTVLVWRRRKGSLMEGFGTSSVMEFVTRSVRRHRASSAAA